MKGGGGVVENGRKWCLGGPFPSVPSSSSVYRPSGDASSMGIASTKPAVGLP